MSSVNYASMSYQELIPICVLERNSYMREIGDRLEFVG
jgi:hypothetical protein